MSNPGATSHSHDRAALLRHRAQAFCKALSSSHPPAPRDLISQFFVNSTPSSANSAPQPTILEHGPHWAAATRLPFLGRPFVGAAACEKYFETLSGVLKMHLDDQSFPAGDGFVVDLEADAAAGGRAVASVMGAGGGGGADGGHHHHGRHLWEPAKEAAKGLLWHGSGASGGGNADANHGLRGTVTVVGRGTFESVATGRKWREEFVYVLGGWDGEGHFERWEVWADPLSAWLAVAEGEVEGWPRGEFAKGGGMAVREA